MPVLIRVSCIIHSHSHFNIGPIQCIQSTTCMFLTGERKPARNQIQTVSLAQDQTQYPGTVGWQHYDYYVDVIYTSAFLSYGDLDRFFCSDTVYKLLFFFFTEGKHARIKLHKICEMLTLSTFIKHFALSINYHVDISRFHCLILIRMQCSIVITTINL